MADSTLMHVPQGVSSEEALLLGDILSTAFFCADSAGIHALAAAAAAAAAAPEEAAGGATGDSQGVTVAVVGCGPVGLLAVLAAQELGATTVFAIDSVPERLALARRFGAVPVDRGSCDPLQVIRSVCRNNMNVWVRYPPPIGGSHTRGMVVPGVLLV